MTKHAPRSALPPRSRPAPCAVGSPIQRAESAAASPLHFAAWTHSRLSTGVVDMPLSPIRATGVPRSRPAPGAVASPIQRAGPAAASLLPCPEHQAQASRSSGAAAVLASGAPATALVGDLPAPHAVAPVIRPATAAVPSVLFRAGSRLHASRSADRHGMTAAEARARRAVANPPLVIVPDGVHTTATETRRARASRRNRAARHAANWFIRYRSTICESALSPAAASAHSSRLVNRRGGPTISEPRVPASSQTCHQSMPRNAAP